MRGCTAAGKALPAPPPSCIPHPSLTVAPALTPSRPARTLSYPTLQNFRFLQRLSLKTVLSLTPEPPTADLAEYCGLMDIELVHVQVSRSAPLNAALMAHTTRVLAALIRADSHPVYVHCLDGRRVCSLVVLLLRRLQGWTPQASFAEFFQYISYNTKALRPVDESDRISEFEKTSKELGRFCQEACEVEVPEEIPSWMWGGFRQTVVPGFRFKYNPPLPTALTRADGTDAAQHESQGGRVRGADVGDGRGRGPQSVQGGMLLSALDFDAHGGDGAQQDCDLGLSMAALDLHGVDGQMERARRKKLRQAQELLERRPQP